MRRSDARDLRRPLLFRAGSAAGQIAARLSGQFDLVPLRPGDPIAVDGPAVLLVERALRDLGRAAGLPGRTKQLALVALLPPGPAPKTIPAQWYACLPRNAPPAVLAKILDNAFEHMATRGDLDRLSVELRDLNSIGVRLSAERDLKRLLELILTKAREITHSDAGSLYLVEESDTGDRRLRFTLAQNDSVDVPFEQFTIPINGESVAGYVALTGEVVDLADAYHPPLGSTFKVNRAFDTQIGYRTKSMLVVPMKTQKEEIIGVLQLINCKPDLQRRFASPGEIEREV